MTIHRNIGTRLAGRGMSEHIEVTVRNTSTGDVATELLSLDTYLVICTGRCYVAHEHKYPFTGSVQITIKMNDS